MKFLKIFRVPLYVAVFIFLLFIILNWRHHTTDAGISVLYPSSCLGGWQNPHNAEGPPDVPPDGTVAADTDASATPVFSAADSAVLPSNTSSEIFCGSFMGDIAPDSRPKSIILTFSWGVSDATATNMTEGQYPIDGSNFASSSVEILDAPATSSPQFTLISASTTVSASTTTSASPASIATTSVPDTFTEATTTNIDTTASVINAVDSDSADISTSSDALAPASSSSPTTPPDTSTTSDSGPSSMIFNLFAQTALADMATDTVPMSTTSASIASSSSEDPDAFLQISYTLDGTTWQSLGTVDPAQMKSTSFEIPVTASSTWNDMSNIQISIQSVPTADIEPTVYLDDISLSVDYLSSDGKPTTFFVRNIVNQGTYLSATSSAGIDTDGNSNNDDTLYLSAPPNTGLAIYNIATKVIVFTSEINQNPMNIDPKGLLTYGDYAAIATNDANWCSGMTLGECKASPGFLGESDFSILP